VAKLSASFRGGAFFLAGFFLSLGARAADCGSGDPKEIHVLSSESFVGKGSVFEALQGEWAKVCAACKLVAVTPKGSSDLVGRLRSEKRRGCKSRIEIVLGLDSTALAVARAEGLVSDERVFDRGTFAFIADTKRFPKAQWPKSWKEVDAKLKGKALVQDPRLSSPGMGWLRAIYEMKALPEAAAKTLPLRVFPSWSSAYEAFMGGQGAVVWSYVTSESYHRCEEKTPADRERYLAIPLEEGYPQVEEWIALTGVAKGRGKARELVELMMGPTIQAKIATTNWMMPASTAAKLPDCMKATTSIKAWSPSKPATPNEVKAWIDRWSL